jgi:HAD superfamily hydrolase (TIGR01509 family)
MNERDYQAVIFDMDGVIVDSEPRHAKAFFEVLREIGYEQPLDLNWDNYVGRSDFEVWQDFIVKFNPEHSLEQLLKMKRERVLEIIRREEPIFAGLGELVKKLSRVCRLGLASGSERPVVEAVLSLQDLSRFFSAVVTATEIKRGKPDPEIFLRAAELLNVSPGACWVIEDSKPGVTAGLAAGMRVIAITNTHPAGELRNATRVVSRYDEIESLLLGQGVSGQ